MSTDPHVSSPNPDASHPPASKAPEKTAPKSAPLKERLRVAIGSTPPPTGATRASSSPPDQPASTPETKPDGAPIDAPSSGMAPEEKPAVPGKPPHVAPPRAKIPVPSRRDATSPEIEQELAAALGDLSVDDLMTRTATSPVNTDPLEIEARVSATVVRIHPERDCVFFSLGGPNEGVAALRQFADPPAVGARMDVVITGYNAEDGLYEVAIPGAAVNVEDWSDLTEGALVEALVTGANTGGLECKVNQIRGFIPASQVAMYRVENFADYVNQKLLCVVTEANPQKRNLVLSRRSVLEREREEARRNLLEQLQEGHVCEGVVRNIRDFGAFVDLGGIDGLIHISQMSWDRINHPSEVLEEGQKVRVRIEKIDRQTGKIGLSLRSLQEHPWEKAPQMFPVGSTVRGVVTRIARFGAFVKLSPGVEGLIHISELSHQRVANVASVVQEGQEVQVKVVSMDAENQRIGLSLKALAAAPPKESEEEADEAATPEPAPAATPRNRGPLKGGIDRGSGGDRFGLKW